MGLEPVVIPDKIYFKIGEVCELLGVQAHVLRYWETEFPMLSPQKNKSGQRSYRRRDVEMALRIKQLLYNEMFTIAGARKKLQTEHREGSKSKGAPAPVSGVSVPAEIGRSVDSRPPMLFDTSPEPQTDLLELDTHIDGHKLGDDRQREVLRTVATQLLELRELLKPRQFGP